MESKTKDILNRPFERTQVKERVGPGGRTLSYVAIGDYIARLNEAFDGGWSYEITDARILDEEVVVQIRLTAGGMVKMGMGGAAITKRRDNGKPVAIAHDLTAAEARGLKRASRLMGIGAALYLDDEEPAAIEQQDQRGSGSRPAQQEGETQNDSPRITNAQLAKLRSLVANGSGDWGAFRNSVRERHRVNVEYADRRLASTLIQEMLERSKPAPVHGGNGNGNGTAHGGNGTGWRRS